MRRTRAGLRRLIALCVAGGAGLGVAQPIKLPDFREEVRSNALCENCATVRSVRELATGSDRPPPGISATA